MAHLERIDIQPLAPELSTDHKSVHWVPSSMSRLFKVPHIFFEDGEPWTAANEYALSKIQSVAGSDIKTVVSQMNHLRAYASWLERQNMDWRYFPEKKKERCLFRYRGELIDTRTAGLISPSTATARMNAITKFYRWAQVNGWFERSKLWDDQTKVIQFNTTHGFSRTMAVISSELSIPNRRRPGLRLENGLLPLSTQDRDVLLRFLHERNMMELYLITMIGFFTGARSETIRTLRINNIANAQDDTTTKGLKRILVGPGTQVKTKFDVSGNLLFAGELINLLERYAYSPRRLLRQSRALEENRTLLFLTERGNPYSETSFTKIISHLRQQLLNAGLDQFKHFKFHRTRATFGTHLMRVALDTFSSQSAAIVFVRDAMLHRDESTTWKYIKFIETEPLKERLSDEFFDIFVGKSKNTCSLIEQVIYDTTT